MLFVAIVGGSGAGKTWLAQRLSRRLAQLATRLSLDDFYADRGHLTLAQRRRINFDHPRAIDWPRFNQALAGLAQGRTVEIPQYDFTVSTRSPRTRQVPAKPLVIVDGLWLLRRPTLRRGFGYRIFIECSARTRLARRLARDRQQRGRTSTAVRQQFLRHTQPMHIRFVEPQRGWADIVVRSPLGPTEVRQLAAQIRRRLGPATRGSVHKKG